MDLHADLSERVVIDTGALARSPSPMAAARKSWCWKAPSLNLGMGKTIPAGKDSL